MKQPRKWIDFDSIDEQEFDGNVFWDLVDGMIDDSEEEEVQVIVL